MISIRVIIVRMQSFRQQLKDWIEKQRIKIVIVVLFSSELIVNQCILLLDSSCAKQNINRILLLEVLIVNINNSIEDFKI
jgi:hypothetical protein